MCWGTSGSEGAAPALLAVSAVSSAAARSTLRGWRALRGAELGEPHSPRLNAALVSCSVTLRSALSPDPSWQVQSPGPFGQSLFWKSGARKVGDIPIVREWRRCPEPRGKESCVVGVLWGREEGEQKWYGGQTLTLVSFLGGLVGHIVPWSSGLALTQPFSRMLPKHKVVIVGVENAEKTTTLYQL